MPDSLTIFGTAYTGVTGIKATQTNDGELTYIRPSGTLSVTANGTVDVTQYASASVNVAASSNDFVVTLAYNDQTEMWEPDRTIAEIGAAYSGGKDIVVQAIDIGGYSVAAMYSYDSLYGMFAYTVYSDGYDSGGGKLVAASYYLDSTGVHDDLSVDYRDTSAADAVESDVAQGKAFFNDSGYHEGTYVTPTARTSSDVTVSGDTVTIPAGAYASQVTKSVASGTAGTPTATKGAVSNHAVSVTPSVTNTTGYIVGDTLSGTAVSVSASELVSGTLSITGSGTVDVTNYASASVAAGGATASATKGAVSNHSVSVTPSVTRTAGYIAAGSANGTAVTVSASELVSGSETKTANGTYDVTDLAELVVNVAASSKNVQTAQSTTRVASTSYTKTASLTCSTSGKYDVYWDCFRSSTSGTNGSWLYIGGSAHGDANTTWASSSVNTQTNHLTNVQINANQEVAVYVRSRGTSYYASCGQLTIVQSS